VKLLSPARLIKTYRRRDPLTPKGTTHVLQHYPAVLLVPDYTGGEGNWDIQTLGNHLAGTPAGNPPVLQMPIGASETDLAAFAERELGFPVTLTRFEAEVSTADDPATWHPAPGFYVTRAAAVRAVSARCGKERGSR
jgi:hypothetical protein